MKIVLICKEALKSFRFNLHVWSILSYMDVLLFITDTTWAAVAASRDLQQPMEGPERGPSKSFHHGERSLILQQKMISHLSLHHAVVAPRMRSWILFCLQFLWAEISEAAFCARVGRNASWVHR